MALFGLGIKAAIKGAGALFKGARTVIKNFRDNRKEKKESFKAELKSDAEAISQQILQNPFGAAGQVEQSVNPLGIVPQPTAPQIEDIQGASYADNKGLFNKKNDSNIPLIAGVVGGLALLFILMKRK